MPPFFVSISDNHLLTNLAEILPANLFRFYFLAKFSRTSFILFRRLYYEVIKIVDTVGHYLLESCHVIIGDSSAGE